MSRDPALEDLYTRKSVTLKPCGVDIKGVQLTDPSIPGMLQRVSLSQPSYGYGEFHIDVTLASQHSPEARRDAVAKIVVCSKHCVGGAEQREFDVGGHKLSPSLQAFVGGGELAKCVRVRINLLRRGVKILFFPAVIRNNDTDRIKSSLRAFRSSLQKPSPNIDPITLDLYLVPGDPGFRDKMAMINGILAVAQAPTHPGAAFLLAQPDNDKVVVDRDALLADFESSAEKEIGHQERPEPHRAWFWDAADRSVCLARAEVGAHQLKLQHNSAVMEHHVTCAAAGVKGTRVNGVRAMYMLYVKTDAPHLLPSQGESCGIRFHGVEFTAPQPPKPPSDEQKLRAIATLMTDLFYDGPSPLTPAAKDTPAFVRSVYQALARFDNREPEHACANIANMGATDFDRLRQSNQSFGWLYQALLPVEVTQGGVTTWRRPKGIYHDTVIKVVRNQPKLLRLPTYDYASRGPPPIFAARRVHLESALQNHVSAAFIAYPPIHKFVVAHAGDGHDEVLEAGHFDFHLGGLDTADQRDFAQRVADSSGRFRCSIVPQWPDAMLTLRLNAIDAAAGQALATDTGRYLLEYSWNGQYQDNVARLPALNMLVSQLNCAPEACISHHFLELDSHQRKIFTPNNFDYGTLSIIGAPGTGKTHAVLVLVLAALMVKGGRVAVVCDNEKQADHFASRLRTMAAMTPNKREPERDLEDGILRVDIIAEWDKCALDVLDEVMTKHIAARTGGRRAEHGEPSSLVARVGALINNHPSHSDFRNDLISYAAELCMETDFRARCRNYVVKIMAGLLNEARAIVTTAVGLHVIRQNAPKILDDVSLIVYPQAADLSETSRLISEVACPNAIVRVLEGSLLEPGLVSPGPNASSSSSSSATTGGPHDRRGRIARARHQSAQLDISAFMRSFAASGAVVHLHTDHRHLGGQTDLLNKLFCSGRLETPRVRRPNPAQAVSQKLVRAALGTPNARTNVVAWDMEQISDPEIWGPASRFAAPQDEYQDALEKAMLYFVRMVMLFGVSAEDEWKRPTVAIICADDAMAHLVRRRMRKLSTSDHVPSLVHVLTLAEAVGREFDYAIHLTARDSDQAGYIGDRSTMVVGISRARLATVTVFTSTGLTNKPRDKDLREFISRLVEDNCIWTPSLKTFHSYCLRCGYTQRNRDLPYCARDHHQAQSTPMREGLSLEQHSATKGPIQRTERMMD
ncbi:hypothetical protein RB598_000013 [Gaeumannomyces tritici]